MRYVRGLVKVLAASAILLSACGDDDEIVPSPTVDVPQDTAPAPTLQLQDQPEPVQQLDPTASVATGGVIEITASENKFAPNLWTTSLEETVTIRVTNAEQQQQHNLRLAGPDGLYDTEDDAVTAPEAVPAGETGELTFAPQAAGNYTFRCDFHAGSMGGRIEVE
jgi:plastocyanin